MNVKQLFNKCYNRLAREGMLKALLSGLIVGFSVNFVVALLLWFSDAKGLWWSLAAWGAITAITTPIFYLLRYKPNKLEIAKRLDGLGLDERMITMTEFYEEDSFIAQKQRENAKSVMDKLNVKSIRFKIPKIIWVPVIVLAVFASGMTTVTGLSDAGIIKGGDELGKEYLPEIFDPPVEMVTITYVVEEGGALEGDEVQILEKGTKGANATPVIAVADDGWMFKEWSDGVKDPAREDLRIMEDMTLIATFAPIGDGDGDGEPEPGEGEPEPGDEPGPPNNETSDQPPPPDGSNGVYEENNMVLDNETYYRDIFEVYYQDAMDRLAAGEDLPRELRDLIQTYFDVIL